MTTIVLALTILSSAQSVIPGPSPYEVRFAIVEAVLGLPEIRSIGGHDEARVMERIWGSPGPGVFLRIVRDDGRLRAQVFQFWVPGQMAPHARPSGDGIDCGNGICVRPIEFKDPMDWSDVLKRLGQSNPCPSSAPPGAVSVCADCEQAWIKSVVSGAYREHSCQSPTSRTLARELLDWMKTAAPREGR